MSQAEAPQARGSADPSPRTRRNRLCSALTGASFSPCEVSLTLGQRSCALQPGASSPGPCTGTANTCLCPSPGTRPSLQLRTHAPSQPRLTARSEPPGETAACTPSTHTWGQSRGRRDFHQLHPENQEGPPGCADWVPTGPERGGPCPCPQTSSWSPCSRC